MDPEIISWAYKLKSLVDGKHQLARAIDASTRQLIHHVISQSPQPTTLVSAQEYRPSKEALKMDLQAFANAVFRQLSKPPLPPPIDVAKALRAHTTALDKTIMAQTARLMAHSTQLSEPISHVVAVVENIDKNVVGISNQLDGSYG
jgi:hypothetical protein